MSRLREFSPEIAEKLQYYVYVYSDPDTGKPFYIGKGKGNRCFAHINSVEGDSEKNLILQDLIRNGKDPVIEILVHGIENEETALKIEAAAIDLVGIDNLSNVQKGHHSAMYGRIDVDDINARYGGEKISAEDITEKVIMIRINQLYHYGMSDIELYDATRSCWNINKHRADNADFVFSLYEGMIIEVYRVTAWLPANSTMRAVRPMEKSCDRLEFVGVKAEENIRKKYVGKMINDLFQKGNRNPIRYINV